MRLFLHLSGISLELYCQKSYAKSWGLVKNIKKRDGHIGDVVYKRG